MLNEPSRTIGSTRGISTVLKMGILLVALFACFIAALVTANMVNKFNSSMGITGGLSK